MAGAASVTMTMKRQLEPGDGFVEHPLVPVSYKFAQLIELNESLKHSDMQLLTPAATTATAAAAAVAAENNEVVTFVKEVHEAANTLECVIKHWIDACRNEVVRRDMSKVCEQLQVASNSIYVTMNQLERDSTNGMCKQLINAAKQVLQQTFQVLVIASSCELKELPVIISQVKNKVASLKLNSSKPDLVNKYFKELSGELVLLNNICMRHHDKLGGQQRLQDLIVNCSHTITMTIPTLEESLTECASEPKNKAAKANRDFLLYQILNTMALISDTVVNKLPIDLLESREAGQFTTLLEKAKSALTDADFTCIDEHFEMWIYLIIKHAMFVAHFIEEERRSPLDDICRKLLEAKNCLFDLQTCPDPHSKHLVCQMEQARLCSTTYEDECDKAIEYLYQLEDRVNHEILYLMVNVFAETSEPLERLLDPILFPESNKCSEDHLMLLLDYFYNHLDNMYEVARFIVASSNTSKFMHQFEMTIKTLECLDPEISSLVNLHIQNISVNTLEISPTGTSSTLKNLLKEWKKQLGKLVFTLDSMVDPVIFITLSLKRLEDEMKVCIDAAERGNLQYLLRTSRSIRAKCCRVVFFLTNVNSNGIVFPDPVHILHITDQIHKSLKVHKVQHKLLKRALLNSSRASHFHCKIFLDSTTSLLKQIWLSANFVCSSVIHPSVESTQSGFLSPILTPTASQGSVHASDDMLLSNSNSLSLKYSLPNSGRHTPPPHLISSRYVGTKLFYQNSDKEGLSLCSPKKCPFLLKPSSSCPNIGDPGTQSSHVSPSRCVFHLGLNLEPNKMPQKVPFEFDSFLDCPPLPFTNTKHKHDTLV
ncbi:uncharacterized protein LOC115219168 isoform X1 [Argonauta hians]